VARVWDDRLAEIWAAPGKAGTGVVIGTETVLTARHVVVGALDGGDVLARVVRPGVAIASWVPMAVLAEDPGWDVALLAVRHMSSGITRGSWPDWLRPSSPSPVFARLGTSVEPGCELAGFPQSEVQRTPEGSLAGLVRQTEQPSGVLSPAGQGKTPVAIGRRLPQRWMPLDIYGSTPGAASEWRGMSGAGVLLPDGRMVGIVVGAETRHQQRRLYVVPLADVLDHSASIGDALASALGAPVIAEVRQAPLFRDVLHDQCLGSDGQPARIREASLRAFGVKVAGDPGRARFP
jgi:hypothetical protein